MLYAIGAIVITAIFFIVTSLTRKRIYQKVDQLESWKIEMMNRPLSDEIGKLKGFTIAGETEEKFESWRNEWDDIVATQLPDLEERLLDAEELAEKYRFKKANVILDKAYEELEQIDRRVETIRSEIDTLLNSHEQNHEDYTDLKQTYREVKQKVYAHYRSLGSAALFLEKRMSYLKDKLKEADDLMGQGDVLLAQDHLNEVKTKLDETKQAIEDVPAILSQINHDIPAQIQEMTLGLKEMKAEGYVLDHLQIEELESEANEMGRTIQQQLKEGSFNDAHQHIEQLVQKVEGVYDSLEEEVKARQIVANEQATLAEACQSLKTSIEKLNEETERVKQTYYIEDEELEAHKNLEKAIDRVTKQFETLKGQYEQTSEPYTVMKEAVLSLKEEVQQYQAKLESHWENVRALRQGELKAKETLNTLRATLNNMQKTIYLSNLPGVPDDYMIHIENANNVIKDTYDQLDNVPLDMEMLNRSLEEAERLVYDCEQKTDDMVENARLTESLIQYGNRYRSRSAHLDEKLKEAERDFRQLRYDEALEKAAEALKQVDSDALTKAQKMIDIQEASMT